MSAKEFKVHCKIIDYVASVNPELATIMRAVCSDMPLSSTRGKPGITFLMPTDKALLSKIETLAYSDKIEDAEKARLLLNALIINDVFRTPSEWKSREVPNAILPNQIVDVDSVTAKEVTFKSGAKAVLDERFKDSSPKHNLAVWKLISGEIPVTTDRPATQKQQPKRGKTGAYEPTAVHSQSLRYKIGLAVENAYIVHRASNSARDVYCEHTFSLIDYIVHVRKDTALMYDKVLPLLAFDKMDFYFLVEPHRPEGEYLIDSDIISSWWASRNHTAHLSAVTDMIDHMMGEGTGALVYSDRAGLCTAIAAVRQKLIREFDSRPRESPADVARVYDVLESANTINGVGPVYPAGLASYYKRETGLKMMHDELRFMCHHEFARLEQYHFDPGHYHQLVNMIGECLHADAASRDHQRKLLNKNTMKYLICPTENVNEIKIFISSTTFLQIPLTHADAQSLKHKNSLTRPDPSHLVVYNLAALNHIKHKRLLSAESSVVDQKLASMLASLDVNKLDPKLREALAAKLAGHV